MQYHVCSRSTKGAILAILVLLALVALVALMALVALVALMALNMAMRYHFFIKCSIL